MTALELKTYIFKNDKVEYVLSEIGCRSIKYHENKEYYSCTNAKGGDCNNDSAINIKNNPYLNYINYTRGVSADDQQDIISLVQYNLDLDFVKAMKYLHKILSLQYRFNKKPETEIKKEDPLAVFKKFTCKKKKCNALDFQPMDENVLEDFVPYLHIDWYRDGVMPWTAKKFGLCYSYRWKRVIIPHRWWLDGSLLGYNARTTVENYDAFDIKKYYLTPGMNKSINLYGLWEHYDDIQKAGYVIVYESERSTLRRDSLGDCTGVALSGHTMSDEQIRILIGLGVDIIISMDKDVPREEVRHMCNAFYGIRNVYYTWDSHDVLQPKESIADRDCKTFDWFFKYKIKYDATERREYLKGLENK